jgi:glutamate--cysteine ligase
MGTSLAMDDRPVETMEDLLLPFHQAMKPRARHRIGAEAEKFGVDVETGAPLPYQGEKSVLAVMEALAQRHAWAPDRETENGPMVALLRADASITLEPGGQLELSGAPLEDVHQICHEFSGHLAELRDISKELGVMWLGVGFHPLARQAELDWVPKQRYAIMKRYLPTRGKYGLDMMRRTSTVQANYDYENEAAAMRMLRVSLRLSPLVTAMFANSPFYEGAPFGGRSYRAQVWLSVDPDRQGLLEHVLADGSSFVDYIEWALDAPMFLVKRGEKVVENTGQSFRSYMRHGFAGEHATLKDWETHLNTLFPEVRLKRTIEVRGADSLPARLICALPALWTGIFYDDQAMDQAEELCRDFTFAELEALRPRVVESGLRAAWRGAPLADLAEKVVEIASGGLARRARLNNNGQDERIHLAKLVALVEKAWCPADALTDGIDKVSSENLKREILARARI